jgi:hypothetical protein
VIGGVPDGAGLAAVRLVAIEMDGAGAGDGEAGVGVVGEGDAEGVAGTQEAAGMVGGDGVGAAPPFLLALLARPPGGGAC